MKKNKPFLDMTKRFMALIFTCLIAASAVAPAWSEESWRASFDDICSKVDSSGSLSEKELAALIERVDKLVPEIQASSDPSKKIYLQRIKRCRSLFEFMIESKKSSAQ